MSAPSVPQNVLAAHVGGGAVLLQWQYPATGTPVKYEVWAGIALTGTYTLLPNGTFTELCGYVRNVPLGDNVYFQVCAINAAGEASNFAQASRGAFDYPTFMARVKAVKNSVIPAGSVFVVIDKSHRLIAVQAVEEIIVREGAGREFNRDFDHSFG